MNFFYESGGDDIKTGAGELKRTGNNVDELAKIIEKIFTKEIAPLK